MFKDKQEEERNKGWTEPRTQGPSPPSLPGARWVLEQQARGSLGRDPQPESGIHLPGQQCFPREKWEALACPLPNTICSLFIYLYLSLTLQPCWGHQTYWYPCREGLKGQRDCQTLQDQAGQAHAPARLSLQRSCCPLFLARGQPVHLKGRTSIAWWIETSTTTVSETAAQVQQLCLKCTSHFCRGSFHITEGPPRQSPCALSWTVTPGPGLV